MKTKPKAFLSYSHRDRETAERLAHDLTSRGVDVWWDVWEMRPGVSLVKKIMRQGLVNCEFFLVLLTPASIASPWVEHELDEAFVRRVKGECSIIPIIGEDCKVPSPLQSLLWVDLTEDYDQGLRELLKALHEVSDKPPIGPAPPYVESLRPSIGELSELASTVGAELARNEAAIESNVERPVLPEEIQQLVPDATPEEINDAIDELWEAGLVEEPSKGPGKLPYVFRHVQPNFRLYQHFQGVDLGYSPEEDVRRVAACIVNLKKDMVEGHLLTDTLGLPKIRVNRAIGWLAGKSLVEVPDGTCSSAGGFAFRWVRPTRKTRQFVAGNQ